MLKIEEAPEVQTEIATAEIEETTYRRTVQDILIELRICLAEGDDLKTAIETIESNF